MASVLPLRGERCHLHLCFFGTRVPGRKLKDVEVKSMASVDTENAQHIQTQQKTQHTRHKSPKLQGQTPQDFHVQAAGPK
eukprot:5199024-Amphidinium_carterae.1